MTDTVKSITTLLNNSEGRDKFMKLHQYLARMFKDLTKDSNKELANRLDILFSRTFSDHREYKNCS